MNNNNTCKKYFEDVLIHSLKESEYILNHPKLYTISSHIDARYIGFVCESIQIETTCKSCGCFINKIKDRKITYPLFGIINGKNVLLKLHKKLFYCSTCKVSTMETPIDIAPYAQKSDAFINLMISDLSEQTTYSIVSRHYNVSVSNVIYHFDKYRTTIEKPNYDAITHIAVDEVRFIPTSGKYQFVVMDHQTGNIVDILENRYGSNVQKYLTEYLPHIKLMSQDFWEPYKNAVKEFKDPVTIVADRFHLARFGSWGFNRTRVSLQKETGMPLGKSWKLQTKSRHKLDFRGKLKVDEIIKQHPRLEAAYKAKNYFFAILRMTTASEYEYHIQKWLTYIHSHKLNEFYFIETTLNNWNTEIQNMYNNAAYSNGSIERINRTIKQAKNLAFGFKNLARATDLIKLRTSA